MSTELQYGNKKFTCPHCKAIAQQEWKETKQLGYIFNNLNNHIYLDYRGSIEDYYQSAIKRFLEHSKSTIERNLNFILPNNLAISECQSCNNYCLWVDKEIVYPKNIPVEVPNSDMNQDIQDLYNEAASILMDSPKGSTALLRLALQKLLEQLGETGNINNSIGNLVQRGLSPKIQQALDVIRVVGNNAVHPGEINLDDNIEVAMKLFKIVNIIAQDMITHPKEIEDIYDDLLPDGAREAIERRDS